MKSTDGRCLARLQPRLYEGHGHVLFLVGSLAVSQVSARHKKHDMEIVCIPVVLFLCWPLVDELNSLCLVDHSKFKQETQSLTTRQQPTTQPDINMHLSKHATPSHERHQRHSHCHMCAGQKVPHKASTHACNDSHSGVFFPPTANNTPSTKPARPSPHDICTPPATPAAIAQ